MPLTTVTMSLPIGTKGLTLPPCDVDALDLADDAIDGAEGVDDFGRRRGAANQVADRRPKDIADEGSDERPDDGNLRSEDRPDRGADLASHRARPIFGLDDLPGQTGPIYGSDHIQQAPAA